MRFLISVDMEGVAGVVDPDEISPGAPEYERSRRLMTEEASAVVRGVLAAEPDAVVTVCDAHARYRNVLPDELVGGCRLIRGEPRRFGMLAGIEEAVDAVLLVGYHAAAGTRGAVLAHTISGSAIAQVRWNGLPIGEIDLNAKLAAHFGAATIFVSGDDMACAEAQAAIPDVVVVAVKRALGNRAADGLHPAEACRQLQASAESAVRHRAPSGRTEAGGVVELEIDLLRPVMADRVARIPGTRRGDSNTVAFRAADASAAHELVDLVAEVAA